jgi:hypothetical protein
MQVSALSGVIVISFGSLDLGDVAHLWHMRIEQSRHRVEIVAEQPGVDVERHRRRRVPQHALNGLDVRSSRDRQRRRGVPEVVRRQASDPGGHACRIEHPVTPVAEPQGRTGG